VILYDAGFTRVLARVSGDGTDDLVRHRGMIFRAVGMRYRDGDPERIYQATGPTPRRRRRPTPMRKTNGHGPGPGHPAERNADDPEVE
jgi:hypothetical protein